MTFFETFSFTFIYSFLLFSFYICLNHLLRPLSWSGGGGGGGRRWGHATYHDDASTSMRRYIRHVPAGMSFHSGIIKS